MNKKKSFFRSALAVLIGALFASGTVARANTASSPAIAVDTRDYRLVVSSSRGSPVPPVGTNTYAWRSTVTASVQNIVSSGIYWQTTGWAGSGSIPGSGASNITGNIVLTSLVSSIEWQWSTGFGITNVVATQRPGTKLVDITYDIVSDVTNAVPVTFLVSENGTNIFSSSATGAVGAVVLPGVGRAIVWNAATNWNYRSGMLDFTVRHSTEAQFFATGKAEVETRDFVDDDGPNDPLPGDPDVSDPNENGTALHPYDSIQKAIDGAAPTGAVILVLDGTYAGVGNKDINLRGKQLTLASLNGPDSVAVDVASVNRGFIANSGETTGTVIRGFTIRTWADFFGREGILCDNASPTIENCRIWDSGVAGILITNGAAPVIRNTIVESNPGGIKIYGSSPVIERCLIRSNYAGRGAGILIEGNSRPLLVNTLIVGNRSTNDGGGLYVGLGSSPTNINCVIADNTASNRGSAVTTEGAPVFRNTIVWDNVDPAADPIDLKAGATFGNSIVQESHPGIGNTNRNPLFAGNGKYTILAGSPGIDRGTPSGAPTVDYYGLPRPVDGDGDGTNRVDIGAYEFGSIPTAWLVQYGLSTNGTGVVTDTDQDGFNNWSEWRAGTNPTNSGSFFRFNEFRVPAGGGPVITWPSLVDRTYAIDRSTNLSGIPAFSGLISNITGLSGFTSHTDTTANALGPYIYRVIVE